MGGLAILYHCRVRRLGRLIFALKRPLESILRNQEQGSFFHPLEIIVTTVPRQAL